jgi:hypothetical protein
VCSDPNGAREDATVSLSQFRASEQEARSWPRAISDGGTGLGDLALPAREGWRTRPTLRYTKFWASLGA